ncbi:MAG TPA: hypothetical protein VM487_10430 [Phycisphaerae bacterium]|nr:hypothetical protein [Phycisphaerae bacterium]
MVSNLIDNYADTFAVVEYHVNDAYAEPYCAVRGAFYNIWSDGIPWFAYDGLFDAWPINTYETKLQQRLTVPTPVTMDVSVAKLSDYLHRITIEVCLEPDAEPVDLRLYAVVVEDYYPSNPSYSRNTFRVETPTVDISLAPGECHTDTREVTMEPDWDPENLKVIAWAQEPLDQIPAEVYQAAKAYGPFPVPGDLNGDGCVDQVDLGILLADWGCTGGDCPGDCDGDGNTDQVDLGIMLANWGVGCP